MHARLLLVLLAALTAPACDTTKNEQRDPPGDAEPVGAGRTFRLHNSKGPGIYVLEGDTLRTAGEKAQGGWYHDGAWIRRGDENGKKLFLFSRGELHRGEADGPVLLRFVGRRIENEAGETLFTIQNGVVHRGAAGGAAFVWIGQSAPEWAVAMVIHALGGTD